MRPRARSRVARAVCIFNPCNTGSLFVPSKLEADDVEPGAAGVLLPAPRSPPARP